MTISIGGVAKPKVKEIGNPTIKKALSKNGDFGRRKKDTKKSVATDTFKPSTLSDKKKKNKHASAKENSSTSTSKSDSISAGLQKRLSKRAILKSSKPKVNEESTCLLLLPAAKRLQLYKKGSKRHAFATFATKEDCQEARKQLEGLSMDNFKIRVTFVGPRLLKSEKAVENQNDSIPLDQTITLSNLPFAATKAQLEEEFPTATEIILNTNKHGRFRGSCLLKFESMDDCKVTLDACRGKKIGGRPVKCRVGTYFTTVPRSEKPICGVKVRHVPLAVEDSQLKALFPNDVLLKFRSNVDDTKSSRTAVFIFRDRNAQKAALERFNGELLFGLRLPARPWAPRSKHKKAKPVYDSNEKSSEGQSSVQETQHKAKKHKIFSQLDSAETHHVIPTPDTPNKPKKRRLSDMDETEPSFEKEDCDVKHGVKKHKRLSQSSSVDVPDKTTFSPQLNTHPTGPMKTPKLTPTPDGIKSANSSVVTGGSKEKRNSMTEQITTPSFGNLKKKKNDITQPGVNASFDSPSLTSSNKKKQHKRTFSNISSP
ncbi:hypothetical protein P879_06378 [Paragonimus westermani]|uniref:RRM domain-containing protein n=1 Tax=Paragonimus westermani TaxID=34504 RepID=A0A8T0D4H6_9TREM|nr:hypothetical protein P879_06378 [Paragonimus westermani]